MVTVATDSFKTVFSPTLKDIQTQWEKYIFGQAEWSSQPDTTQTNSSFGTVTSHIISHGSLSETEISLSKATIEALSTAKLGIDRVSSCEVKLYCDSINFILSFSFPINYNTIKMKRSKSKGSLTVSCQRQPYSLEEERPCFTVSPDHCLSIVPATFDLQRIHSQSLMQLTNEESQLVASRATQPFSAQIQVKTFLKILFENAMSCSFFTIPLGKNAHCLIVINQMLFDYQARTPALDLAFCFVNDSNRSDIVKKWKRVADSSKIRSLPLEEAGLKYLHLVLAYFSRRTNGTLFSAGSTSKFVVLQKLDLGHAFTRCVLYLLLCDPDVKLYASGDPSSGHISIDSHSPRIGGVCCAFCKKRSFTSKKCSKCKQVSYCSKTCQTRHWKAHKRTCIPATANLLLSSHSVIDQPEHQKTCVEATASFCGLKKGFLN